MTQETLFGPPACGSHLGCERAGTIRLTTDSPERDKRPGGWPTEPVCEICAGVIVRRLRFVDRECSITQELTIDAAL